MHQVTVDRRFNGPPDSGNGGYVMGLVAELIEGDTATVTLRAPPPLDVPLDVVRDGSLVSLVHGGDVVAVGRPDVLELEVPRAVPVGAATDAVARYPAYHSHIFPTCFVCGPAREPGDGLRLFAGPVDDRQVVATPWTPSADLAVDGLVRPRFMYAALDCPSYFAFWLEDQALLTAVLGRFTTRVRRLARVGERCVVMAWQLQRDGRKHFSASAVTTADGELLAVARATWIELRPR
jgi:hypothetical protein